MKHSLFFVALFTGPLLADPPAVKDVRAAQIPGTHKVRIEYDLAADAPCDIKVQVSLDGGANYGLSLSDDLFPEAMRKNVTAGNRATGTQKSITLTVAETVEGVITVKVPELYNQFTKQPRSRIWPTTHFPELPMIRLGTSRRQNPSHTQEVPSLLLPHR